MSVAMTKLYKQMFKSCYKSYYTKEDINLLDEYRTIANCGILSNTSKEVLSEIDIGKAYTSGFDDWQSTDVQRIWHFSTIYKIIN